ncbi:MAG: KpsF/GutQ family sugar-phosphate isomerase [Rickettsia endosymbiont of Ixodes persulcatus]|nr:KpsF/GutQ family sugar-phosphate isomerase [Rickettsia endosymbiont of Ixodes persulcatus]MCZ6902262.1 KpsF/GutQ family sugar-phosphate isomerase [Rickettsia endosymbiont of Ixodes persulcatus]MCZ6903801.1 KpsF/GutQ family sugar-phosphate isomerase [Rickettsia endosymbiont of Ixodes persulcatus]MCZ6908668.1 KpsF/GutQ family sugar-phosphate isomerase [Rickettsia endosymbiont of Ixodes persulcatus]MCZ6909583.1 KpsF/GutQ family sugar-phosphate isomerase [Rickettsia endosymbiont of Ixodes persul
MTNTNNYRTIAKRVISSEASALEKLSENIPEDFNKIIEFLLSFKGRVILTGIGKSGYIARKIASSFSSTGMPAFYLHPAEASHGDLGMVMRDDLVIMLSNSGETKELFNIIEYCKHSSIKIAVMTMNKNSTLAKRSDFLLIVPEYSEASVIGAPTISSLIMLSLGDALMTVIHEERGFTKDDFKVYHPGGTIGANLTKIKNLMRSGDEIPLVYEDTSFAETIIVMNKKRLGCTLVTDKNQNLVGIITDGDLHRHINDQIHLKTASNIMTKNPIHISSEIFAKEALNLMKAKNITNVPIVDDNIITGIIHIHDLLRIGAN